MSTSKPSQSPPPPDETFISRALEQANLNALRMALYQASGRDDLAAMAVEREPFWGGSFFNIRFAESHLADFKAIARDLLGQLPFEPRPQPSDTEIRRMMSIYCGRPLTDVEFRYGLEQLALEDFPREVRWQAPPPPASERTPFHVLVIGAGLGGIASAIQLQRLGISYSVIERNAGVGGTWWVNNYPDARVDVPSHMYQYTAEKNYRWKHYFATADELREYAESVARKYDVFEKIRFNAELTEATWDEASSQWQLRLRGPSGDEIFTANAIISAAGLFNAQNLPDIQGIGDFQGKIFHSTRWDQDYDYRGKRIGVIGTGSTGGQMTPRLAQDAAHVTVFQRSPGWVFQIAGYRDSTLR